MIYERMMDTAEKGWDCELQVISERLRLGKNSGTDCGKIGNLV